MAGNASKNNVENRAKGPKGKFVTSTDCEGCKDKCRSGELYLKRFAIKHEGNGVMCFK